MTIAVRATVVEVVDVLVVLVLVVDELIVVVFEVLDDALLGTTLVVGAWADTVVDFSLHPASNPTIRPSTAPRRLVMVCRSVPPRTVIRDQPNRLPE